MAQQTEILPAFMPMTWRKHTPVHRKLGSRAARFWYPAGAGLPLIAAPGTLNLRYDAINAIDRIIGFQLCLGKAADTPEFIIQDLNTNWFFDHLYTTGVPSVIWGCVETMPDQCALQWYSSGATTRNVYLAFYNFEVVPAAY
jgi:hypothetical protein